MEPGIGHAAGTMMQSIPIDTYHYVMFIFMYNDGEKSLQTLQHSCYLTTVSHPIKHL